MICQLRGTIGDVQLEKDCLRAVVDVRGVGYEVLFSRASADRLARAGETLVLVSESVTAYDGATTLYGFLTREEKEIFLKIRENVGGMGPKKALEAVDKVSKSLPDFKRAVIEGDVRFLVSVFGFTKKTAEKIAFALKTKAGDWSVSGPSKWTETGTSSAETEAMSGLVNLGYRPEEARALLQKAKEKAGEKAATAELLSEALRQSAAR